MKLLLDENLSRRLVPFLHTDYPGSQQVALLGLEKASDREIWQYAKNNNYVIVTKDSDYHELSILYGAPPQIIWLKTGNDPVDDVGRPLIICEMLECNHCNQ